MISLTSVDGSLTSVDRGLTSVDRGLTMLTCPLCPWLNWTGDSQSVIRTRSCRS